MILFLFGDIPTIPARITSEGLVAVLFLILVGVAGLFFALKGGYLRLGRNGESLHKDEISILLQALLSNTTAIQAMASEIRELKSALGSEAEIVISNQKDIRAHIHDRITPTLAGLTIAYLKMVKEDELADGLRQDMPEARIPRSPKKPL